MEETKGHIAIGEADRAHLGRSAKWAGFIAIVQFIFIGLGLIFALIMLLAGSVASASLSDIPGWEHMPSGFFTGYALFIIIMLVVSFFIALYLYRFSTNTLQAIREGNDAVMTRAFENLGKYFRIQGILLIIALSLMVISLICVAAFAGAMASSF